MGHPRHRGAEDQQVTDPGSGEPVAGGKQRGSENGDGTQHDQSRTHPRPPHGRLGKGHHHDVEGDQHASVGGAGQRDAVGLQGKHHAQRQPQQDPAAPLVSRRPPPSQHQHKQRQDGRRDQHPARHHDGRVGRVTQQLLGEQIRRCPADGAQEQDDINHTEASEGIHAHQLEG